AAAALPSRLKMYFYPRSPRGERLWANAGEYGAIVFLPALPARGATPGLLRLFGHRYHFYPRSPRGERPTFTTVPFGTSKFLPALPARGATDKPFKFYGRLNISTRAPREGSDPITLSCVQTQC